MNISTIVFDIDNVICVRSISDWRLVKFYNHYGHIITIPEVNPKFHYLFPGVIESAQLMKAEGIKFAFFSAGAKKRNDFLAEEVMKLAFPGTEGKSGEQEIKVGSGQDLTLTSEEAKQNCKKVYGVGLGNKHKDIKQVSEEGAQIENAILWDDNPEYAAPDQLKNCLCVPLTNTDVMTHLGEKAHLYDDEGFRPICWGFAPTLNEIWLRGDIGKVKGRSRLLVVKEGATFEIHFIDQQSKEYKKQRLTTEENGPLVAALNQFYKNFLNGKSSVVHLIKDEELIKKLNSCVDAYGGIWKKIWRQGNRLSFAVGLYFTAKEKAKAEGLSISEALFQLQFEKEGESYTSKFKQLSKTDEFYILGSQKLQTVNPNFKLLSGRNYLDCLNKKSSQEEEDLIAEAIRD